MKNQPKVTVIGSANIDLVVQTDRQPQLGETIIGKSFHQFIGGKGANQAVAASRLGADVTFIGCVGQDDYGKLILTNFEQEQVNVEHVYQAHNIETGIAQITITENDNMIVVIPGANHHLSVNHIKAIRDKIKDSDVVILQLEIPLETVKAAIEIAYEYSVPTILNPAPAVKLSKDLLEKATFITPNKSEIETLISEKDIDNEIAIKKLLSSGANTVVLTLGDKGVIYGKPESDSIESFEACKITPVDSTGAGDTFNAAFAVSVASGIPVSKSIEYANYAAALSITRLGAQTGMPTASEVDKFIELQKKCTT